MDKSTNPFNDLAASALAQACEERAGELQARASYNAPLRNALRLETAELLSAAAQHLSTAAGATPTAETGEPLSASELSEIIHNHVQHQPLGPAAGTEVSRHTWIKDFVPGAYSR